MEENPAEFLPVLLPVVGVVTVVVVLVAVVYWLGSGSKPSFEEAKALASKKAEEKLKEREKRHASPRPFKPRKGRKRKNEETQEDVSGSSQPAKGILKSGGEGETAVLSSTPGNVSSERPKVDFKLDATPPKVSVSGAKQIRVSPPTPYPKDSISGDRASKFDKNLPAPMLDIDGSSASAPTSEKPEVKNSATSVAANPPSPKASSTSSPKPGVASSHPAKVPTAATNSSSSNSSSSSAASTSEKTGIVHQQKKPKGKPKHQAVLGKGGWGQGQISLCTFFLLPPSFLYVLGGSLWYFGGSYWYDCPWVTMSVLVACIFSFVQSSPFPISHRPFSGCLANVAHYGNFGGQFSLGR